jgi:extradiol dioxygenase family protein
LTPVMCYIIHIFVYWRSINISYLIFLFIIINFFCHPPSKPLCFFMSPSQGRSSKTWIDYNFWGHQIVCHWAGNDYKCVDYFNSVDIDMVPVPHFGVCLTVEGFHALAEKVKKAGVKFVVEPHLRFPGEPGEQWTMFFKDPSG